MRISLFDLECGWVRQRHTRHSLSTPQQQDAIGEWFLQYRQEKTARNQRFPITRDTAGLLQQQEDMLLQTSNDTPWLFPAFTTGPYRTVPGR